MLPSGELPPSQEDELPPPQEDELPPSQGDVLPPSEKERNLYYYGLPSGPRLVARSSQTIWQHRREGESHPRFKFLKNLGKHKIIDCWNTCESKIFSALEQCPWTSIDVVRVGYRDDEDTMEDGSWPVVLWIGVTPKSLTWAQGMRIIHDCLIILRDSELFDVQCEIRESEVQQLRGPKLLEPVQYTDYSEKAELELPLTGALGQPISTVAMPTWEGTLGIYLSLTSSIADPKSLKIFALTCRHVVLPERPNSEFEFKPERGTRRQDVIILGNVTHQNLIEKAKAMKDLYGETKDRAMQLVQNMDEGPDREMYQKTCQDAKQIMLDCDKFSALLARFSDTTDRIIAHVQYSPSRGVSDQDCFNVDWALLELDLSKFESLPKNVVDLQLGLHMSMHHLSKLLNPNVKSPHQFKMPLNKKLQLRGTIPISEMRKPTMLDENGYPCLIVGKRGKTTGITWGCATEIMSVTRETIDGKTRRVKYWAILPQIDKAFAPFSDKGDSGSAIFDVYGRVGGILTGGAGLTPTSDVTYATPMAFILEDLKTKGYQIQIH